MGYDRGLINSLMDRTGADEDTVIAALDMDAEESGMVRPTGYGQEANLRGIVGGAGNDEAPAGFDMSDILAAGASAVGAQPPSGASGRPQRGASLGDLSDILSIGAQAVQAPPAQQDGDFVRGAKVAWGQTLPLAKGLIGAVGAVGEDVAGEGGFWSGVKDWGIKGYQDGMAKLQPLQHENDDVTKAWDKAANGDFGALVDWAQYGLGYGAVQLGQAAVTGGIGALGGKMIGKGAVEKLMSGYVEKTAAKLAEEAVAAQVAKGVAESAARQAVASEVASGAFKKLAVARTAEIIGATAALQAYNETQEVGSIYPDAVEQATKEGRKLTGSDLAKVWGWGTLSAATESATDVLGLEALTGRIRLPGVGGRVARAASGGLIGGALEGGQEGVQTWMEWQGAGKDTSSPEFRNDLINSMAMGALPGVAVGGASGAVHVPHKTPQDILKAGSVDEAIATASDAVDAPVGLLGHQAGEPLVVFPDGSTATAAEAERWRLTPRATDMMPAHVPEADTEFANLLKDEQADVTFRRRDIAEQVAKERDLDAMVRENLAQQADQSQHITAASGFGAAEPTAMQMAFERARQQAVRPMTPDVAPAPAITPETGSAAETKAQRRLRVRAELEALKARNAPAAPVAPAVTPSSPVAPVAPIAPEAQSAASAQPAASPPVAPSAPQVAAPTAAVTPEAPKTPAAAKVAAMQAKARAPIMRRQDLVGAIMRVTGGRGIHSDMAQDVTGDKANNQPRLRGLFTKQGTSDLGDVAALLRTEEGYDAKDGEHLADLIRRAAAGESIRSMQGQEDEANANAQAEHRDGIRKAAHDLGIKVAFRKFDDVEAEVTAALEAKQAQEVAALDEKDRAEYDELLARARESIDPDDVDAALEPLAVQYQDQAASAYYQAARQRLRALIDEAEHQAAEQRQSEAEGAGRAAIADRQPEAPASERQAFALEAHSDEDLARKEARAADESIADKATADAEREAFQLSAQTQERTTGTTSQSGLFTPDGRATEAAQAKPQKTEDEFEQYLAKLRQDEQRKIDRIGDIGDGMAYKHAKDDRWVILMPDMTEPGKWRMQRFDRNGFSGHEIFDTKKELIADAARSGFTERDPGALDRMQDTHEFKKGLYWADLIRKMNAKEITYQDASRMAKEYADKLEGKSAPAESPKPQIEAKSAEQKIREAFSDLPSVSLGVAYPITIEHNGVTRQFMVRQDVLSNGRRDAALHLTEIHRGRMIPSSPVSWIAQGWKLSGSNELTQEGMPKQLTDAEAKEWQSKFTEDQPDAAPKQEEQVASESGAIPVAISSDAIPLRLAIDAFNGTSHVPEQRGAARQAEYVSTMTELRDQFQRAYDKAEPDRQQAFVEAFNEVADTYASKIKAYLSAHSRVMSAMITGPAKFPRASNEKRIATADRRAAEANEYLRKAQKRLARVLRGNVDQSLVSQLKEAETKLEQREALQQHMRDANVALRAGDDEALAELGMSPQRIAEFKKPDFAGRKGYADYQLSNNSSEIRRLKQRVEDLTNRIDSAEQSNADEGAESKYEGARIVQNAQDSRVQLFFDGKPSEEVRNALKAESFRWSPKNMAWQRQLTPQAVSSATKILDQFYAKDSPGGSQSASASNIRFHQPERAPLKTGVEHARLQRSLQRLASAWQGVSVNVVPTFDDLPQHIRDYANQRNASDMDGVFDTDTATAHIVADRMPTIAYAQSVLLHEVMGHYGLRGTLGASIDPVLSQIYGTNKGIREAADAMMQQYGYSKAEATEEVLSDWAAEGRKPTSFARLVAAIKAWAREHGVLPAVFDRWTDADVLRLIARSREFVEGKRSGAQGAQSGMAFNRGDVTNTPAFRKWFGDSKVVDADGKPLVVYHGSPADISVFKSGHAKHGGEFSNAGIYFSSMRDLAGTYGQNGSVYPVFLSIQNPLDLRIRFPAGTWKAAIAKAISPSRVAELVRQNQVKDDITQSLITATERDQLLSDGFDGIIGEGGTYIAFRPEQIKSAIGNRGTFDAGNPDIRFHRPEIVGDQWGSPEPSKIDDVIYTMQDKQIDTKRVVDAIRKASINVSDEFDPYLQEELYHGRSAKGVKDFLDFELEPLLKDMQMRKLSLDEVETYLWATHAKERNAQVAKINPDMPDGGSGLTNKQADDLLAGRDVTVSGNTIKGINTSKLPAYRAIGKRVNDINAKTRQMLVDSGLETQDTISAWEGAYKNYVPLQREDIESGLRTGQGFSVRGPASKRAMGSGKSVVDILSNIAMMRERTVTRVEKTRVGQAVLGLALQAPNADFWTVDDVPTMRVVENIGGKDQVVERIDPTYRNAPNVMHVRVNGADHFIRFNEHDPRAMRMVESLKNLDTDQLGRVLQLSSKATRWFASVNTQYNPIFGVINLTRDVQDAMLNLTSTGLAGKQSDIVKNTVSALRGIFIDLRDHRAGKQPSSSWAGLWEEFQREGGQTGYKDMFSSSAERTRALQKELAKIQEGSLKHAGRAMFDLLSDYNETMENAVRLAAYKVGKESGLSNQRAASLAKNLTVNFNRKGQIATQAGALYAFFNASVQGASRMTRTLFEFKGGEASIKNLRFSKAGLKIVTGGLMLGAMQAFMFAIAGWDDDEPPEFVRERSIILPLPDGKYLSVPMPLGFNVIPNIARITTQWALSGGKNTTKRIADLAGVFADTFNPIGNAGMSLQTLTPTVIDPLAALAENKDWTGKPIAKQDFNALNPTPGHARAKDTASAISKVMSYWFNLASGGTDYKPGVFSPTPDQLDYLIGQVTGGVGREYMKAEQTASAAVSGEDLPLHKVPLLGRLVGETTGQSAEGGKFYDAIKEINQHEAEIKGLRKAGKAAEAYAYIRENPETELIPAANAAERRVSELRGMKRDALAKDMPKARVQLIDAQITSVMKQFNDRVRKLAQKEAA